MEEYIKRLSLYKKPDLNNIKEVTSAEYYYDPQTHLSTHELIVNDPITMSTFRGWIEDNAQFIKDKIVLDVGCGTGVFSMIAAKVGAKRVISVEWSHIAIHTKKVVKENGLDHIVTVIKANIEDVKLPDDIEQVDVIISMWIGYSLFQGGRLKKVLYARDKWLKPTGIIIPDYATLFITAITDDEFRENNIEWWKNVYGFDWSVVQDDALRYAQFNNIAPEKIVTNMCCIKKINLRTDMYSDIMKEVPFALTATRNDYVQGFCTFFSVTFLLDLKKREINTDPRMPPTHWMQTMFYLKDYFLIRKREKIQGSFSVFGVNNDPRFLGIIIGTCFQGHMDEVLNVKTFLLRS